MKHEIISPIYSLSIYENKIGVSLQPKELQWIFFKACFCPYMLCITRARAYGNFC